LIEGGLEDLAISQLVSYAGLNLNFRALRIKEDAQFNELLSQLELVYRGVLRIADYQDPIGA